MQFLKHRAPASGTHTTRRSPAVGQLTSPIVALRAGARPSSSSSGRILCRAAALPEALLFDCDGVLVDTERDGHRPAFNEAFRRKGVRVGRASVRVRARAGKSAAPALRRHSAAGVTLPTTNTHK